MNITKERAKEILDKYKSGDHALFNWCEEYKDFVSDCVSCNVSMEWEYMLKKSYEDQDDNNPIDHEDLYLFDKDKAKEGLKYWIDQEIEGEQEKIFGEINEEMNLKIKSSGDYLVYLHSLDMNDLKVECDKRGIEQDQTDAEIYEWWIIQDGLKYELEQQGEIFLNDAWGRTCTGQSISLDYCVIKAFIDRIKRF